MKKIVFIVALMIIAGVTAFAQAPDWEWAKGFKGNATDESRDIAIDKHGNVYTTGDFYGTVDFKPGGGTLNLTPVGYYDIFISKLDANGQLIWAKNFGGSHYDGGYSITVDDKGNIYTAGLFADTVDFNSDSVLVNNLIVSDNYGIYILKLDSNGNFIWAGKYDGAGDKRIYDITIDTSGNVYSVGTFDSIIDFNPGIGVNNLTTIGQHDIFIAKLDSSGSYLWACQIGGISWDEGNSITLDRFGNIYTTGFFAGTVDFDPSPTSAFNIIGMGLAGNTFISKLDNSGNFIWAKAVIGQGYNEGTSIAVDSSANVYSTGYFYVSQDFDPSTATHIISSAGEADIFVLKLDSNGVFAWVKTIGGTDVEGPYSLILDDSVNIYICGLFAGVTDLNPGIASFNLTAINESDVFVVKLNSSGNFVWAKQAGGNGSDQATSIALDELNNVFVTGYNYGESMHFGSITLSAAPSNLMFIAKIGHIINGIENITNQHSISFYPNPTTDNLTIQFNAPVSKGSIVLTNTLGEVVYTAAINQQTQIINLKSLSAGIYFVRVQTDEGVTGKKIIKH